MKKRLLIIFAFLLIGISGKVQAYDFSSVVSGQTLYFNITSDTLPYKAEVTSELSDSPYYYTKPTGAVVIPDTVSYNGSTYSVNSIGIYAFRNCSNLTDITIPNSITSIGISPFASCTSLTSIIIPNSVSSIGITVFSNCTSLISATLPDSITSIANGLFTGCTSLESVIIPNTVTSIGSDAFYNCNSLASIIIPNSVTSFGYNAFTGCKSLTSLVIPNSITSIDYAVFSGCTNLTSLTIPNSVTTIGHSAFSRCSSLTSISIPNSVTLIDFCAFELCYSLTSITIPKSVTEVRSFAFMGCTSLDTVVFNAISCLIFGYSTDYVFKDIESNITTLIIGDSALHLPNNEFSRFTNLTSIKSNSLSPPNIGFYTLLGVPKSIPAYVPCLSLQAYQTAPYWSDFTNYKVVKTPQYLDVTICQGETYTDYGANIDSAGTYYLSQDCDSIILTLSVNQITTPINLTLDNIQNYLELSWESEAESYIIYRNNDSIGFSTNTIYKDSNVVDGLNYCYRVKAIDGECDAESVEICKTFAGLNHLLSNDNISISLYPNPTSGKATLEVKGLTKSVDVFIYDITGRYLKTYNLQANQKELNIDLTGFAKGIYQVKVFNQTKKLIVN